MRNWKNVSSANLALLLDTQILVWISLGDRRLPARVIDTITDGDTQNYISAIVAWEFSELNQRGRFGVSLNFAAIVDQLAASIVALPAAIWSISATLPDLHRDPVDRMLIAHAIHDDLTLVTADATIRRYPVKSLW